jgi:cell division protein FtsI/penicillin-binding protein 2
MTIYLFKKDRFRINRAFEMVRRMNRRIPRKGRIRLVLVILLLAAGFKLAISEREDTSSIPAKNEKPAADKSRGPLPVGRSLDRQELKMLLMQTPSRLTRINDTVSVRGDSLVICKSIDTTLQLTATRLFKQYKPRYGALVALDPQSGRVLALCSYRHDSAADLGSNLFLRSIFPAASVFKTVTAAAAIEKSQYTSSTTTPMRGANHTLYKSQLKKEIQPWTTVPLDEAFARSINPVFGRIGLYVTGQRKLQDYVCRFGFNAEIPFDIDNEVSCASAPADTTYEMAEFASGYNRTTTLSPLLGALIASAVASDGMMPLPLLVDSVVSLKERRLVYKSEPGVWRRPVGTPAAHELSEMMQHVVTNGTARKSFHTFNRCAWSTAFAYGGKTGSIDVDTLGKIDWFIGFARNKSGTGPGIAVGIVTVHGSLWTVHSGFIGSEMMRTYLRPQALAGKKNRSDTQVRAAGGGHPARAKS